MLGCRCIGYTSPQGYLLLPATTAPIAIGNIESMVARELQAVLQICVASTSDAGFMALKIHSKTKMKDER